MHIVDGVLSLPVLIAGAVVTTTGCTIGLRQLDEQQLPKVAVLSAAFFVASLLHVPLGPSSVHLIFNGLLGLLLGWLAFPAMLIGLLLQAIFFGFGGLIVLGVNCMNIALPAVLIGLLLRPQLIAASPRKGMLIGALTGSLSLALTAILVALSLSLTGEAFLPTAKLVVLGHLPLMLIEGAISAFCLSFLLRSRPTALAS